MDIEEEEFLLNDLFDENRSVHQDLANLPQDRPRSRNLIHEADNIPLNQNESTSRSEISQPDNIPIIEENNGREDDGKEGDDLLEWVESTATSNEEERARRRPACVPPFRRWRNQDFMNRNRLRGRFNRNQRSQRRGLNTENRRGRNNAMMYRGRGSVRGLYRFITDYKFGCFFYI